MAADSNTSFEFQIASESKEAEKGIENIIKVATKLEDKLDALRKKSGIAFGKAMDADTDQQRLDGLLKYYSIREKIQKIENKARSDNERKSQVSSREKFYANASQLDLLYQKRFNTQNSLQSAIASGDDKKAVASAEQLLRIDRDIEKEKNRVAEEQKKINAESDRTLEVVERIKSVASNIGGVLKSLGGKAIAKITEPFKRMQKSIKTLLSSIGRIAFYRAIRSGIKAVTQGFSEGIKHLYAWSEAFNTKFAPAMDQYKTQMTYLHNGFAAMFSPLIEWVIPNVLTPLTDAMVEFFNLVQQGFATLVGHDYWYKAQKSMTKFGEVTKKANIQLAKFDELNNLTETGSGSDEDASGMFTLEKVSADFGNGFFQELRDAIKNGNWYEVGDTIANGINSAFDRFDPHALADTITGKINGAIDIALGFSHNLNWAMIGTKIGTALNDLLKNTNWEGMGDAIASFAGGLTSLFVNAILEIKIENVLSAIWNFVKGLVTGLWDALFGDNGYLVKKIGLGIARTILGASSWALHWLGQSGIKTKVYDPFTNGLVDVDFSDFSSLADGLDDYLLKPVDDAMETLDREHDEWLKNRFKKQEEQTKTFGSNIVSIFQNTGNSAVRAYQSANWGTTVPTDKIKAEVATSGIDYKYREQATKALSAYTAVQWASGGTVSAEGIKNALIQAGVPASMAMQASESLASFINTLNGGKSSVTNAFNNMTSGYDATGVGRNIGSQIVSGMNSVLVSSPVASVGGGNSNYRITISKNAKGGYLFANGGFASGLSQGTMYVAGEVPGQAEMVGQINGRTGVASGFEITGIRDAVISTGENEAQLLQTLISVLERKNLVISPSAQLGRVMAQSNRLYSGVTG